MIHVILLTSLFWLIKLSGRLLSKRDGLVVHGVALVELIRCVFLYLAEHRLQLFVNYRLVRSSSLLLLVELVKHLSCELHACFPFSASKALLIFIHLLKLSQS